MRVFHGLNDFVKIENAVVTSGTFDGVHFGHQQILARLKEITTAMEGENVVITFWPHPRFVLSGMDIDLKLISTLDEKIERLSDFGVDNLLIIPFDKQFASLSSLEFIQKVLVDTVQTKKLVMGYDHRFGHNREGGFDFLMKNAYNFGFEVEEIPRQEVEEIAVSSTKIRRALQHSDVQTAAKYLGRPYQLRGEVVGGAKLGRKLGFPTANLLIKETYKLIPENGIYAVKAFHNDIAYDAMLNIGVRPTIANEGERSIEVHLFDFNKDIYGETLKIHFIDHLRNEKKFANLEELQHQLSIDKEAALEVLNHF
ncbi:bifunctional riboflavin kinase/FAD synthetase [Flammeovirgaceae bacterium SG7u.111]|nr:bifunctional riboflavin kinase/FAD synthetase [Flammeovirgaceae bacterium SG7u.132]WPO33949.1 bifunctional riboflavin kinase/FAD synthetase [Flammeovirgaceae bacterium SG7u.111]